MNVQHQDEEKIQIIKVFPRLNFHVFPKVTELPCEVNAGQM